MLGVPMGKIFLKDVLSFRELGFILLMALLSNYIEYLSYKLGVTFYDVVNLCSVEIVQHLLT
mgnify:CR=1 FL=1